MSTGSSASNDTNFLSCLHFEGDIVEYGVLVVPIPSSSGPNAVVHFKLGKYTSY